MVMDPIAWSNVRQSFANTDPRPKVQQIIFELHQELNRIDEKRAKADQEDRLQLTQLEHKLQEVMTSLNKKGGPDFEAALQQLEQAVKIDPSISDQIKPQIQLLLQQADQAKQLHNARATAQSGSNGLW
jgi:hypothetical protein